MTSERQRAANRANARKSTGPRSSRGKGASRLNARVHGLATSVWGETGADADINQLADALVAEASRPDLRAAALRVAAAEIDLRRVFRARKLWRESPPVRPRYGRFVASENSRVFMRELRRDARRKNGGLDDFARCLAEAGWDPDAPPLEEKPLLRAAPKDRTPDVLDRYERRAFSRRKAAIRDFDAARAAEAEG